jgi:Family of unknown function (DUF5302)
MTGSEPTPADDTQVAREGTGPAAAESGAAITDPDELMKQRYRDAMAHKHGASGAAKQGHGDAGSSGHAQSAAQTQRLFRRKSGG